MLIAALVSHGVTLRAAAAYAGVHRDTVLAERRRETARACGWPSTSRRPYPREAAS